MKRELGDYIQDILEAMDNATKFIEGMSYDEFVNDTKTFYAVLRAIEVIGESAKKVHSEIRNKYPEIPWKDMAGMRDKVIHEYFGVKIERVWLTIKQDIPTLRPLIQEILKNPH